ncbi:PEP/pyruvate-binding domain-containing protein [Rhizohabitans arisaemae]|uniref:PEP/pyruvate-binding domain-containing protein n=1 Tax=Rhizohabitans arisaemae TaxID=2720610 RepID=UPI0024B1B5FF|nr:PEP/pyruvate-binding domain-containing protein [Rhizohabitans arisaemae]
MTNPLILKFGDIGPELHALVGGKAANLGVLVQAGFPVPAGLCLTTEAYRRVAETADLDDVLQELAQTPAADVAALNRLAERARRLVAAAPVPGDIADAVRGSARGPVAVRSSATAEDLPHASFAGQQDTYLNVVGADAVLDAARRCWASLWTDRAVAYRAANGIDHRSVRLAVVIQEMVQAEIAGVMFTANPVTGRRRQAVIDAAPGLGEAVVSGAVNPDRFVVDPGTGRIAERRLGDKLTAVRSVPGGGTEHAEVRIEGACVTDEQVRALAALGAEVEDHYGAPQDVEWAIDAAGTIWLTQARPVTTLYPVPEPNPANLARIPGDLRVYFSANVAQGVFRPITPMGMSAFRVLSSGAARLYGLPVADHRTGAPVFAEAGERIYIDITGIMRSRAGRTLFPRLLDVMEARSAKVLRGLLDDPRLSLTRTSWLPLARRLARLGMRFKIPPRAVQGLMRPETAHRRAESVLAEARVRLTLPPDLPPLERLDRVERVLAGAVPMVPPIAAGAIGGFLMLGLAHRLLGARAKTGDLQTVLRGVPHNVTTEMDLDLWRLAAGIRDDAEAVRCLRDLPAEVCAERFHAGSLPPILQTGLTAFLDGYGHRAVAEIDLGMPRWSEDPRHILGVLANYLGQRDPDTAADVLFAKGAGEADRMIKVLGHRAGGLRGAVVRFALGRARALVGLREMPKFVMVTLLAGVRSHLKTIGAELVGRGLLDGTEDVFFLNLGEVRAALGAVPSDLRRIVAERREVYDRELRRRHIPRVLLSDGTDPEAVAGAAAPVEGALTGTPASAGTVTGKARVVLDPVGASLEPGEILVCPSTDPGWTPLFLTAGGLVMEMGGANSHGAVVAREYGIPAVVGVDRATEHLTTGRTVTVDGTSGTVAEVTPAAL